MRTSCQHWNHAQFVGFDCWLGGTSLFFPFRLLWRQWRVIPGLLIYNSIWDSLCWLVTSHKPVMMSFCLQKPILAPEGCFLQGMAVFSAQLRLCWQRSYLPCENPFHRNETKQWKQTARGNRGFLRGQYPAQLLFICNWQEENPGVCSEWPVQRETIPIPV